MQLWNTTALRSVWASQPIGWGLSVAIADGAATRLTARAREAVILIINAPLVPGPSTAALADRRYPKARLAVTPFNSR
ncbi:hypothetical protein GCM10010983_38590 [Caulobacter rhizosphaerae]|nr:hypothetical protein GCM10010983_38590 [Caulobacter rhizosphaerae]